MNHYNKNIPIDSTYYLIGAVVVIIVILNVLGLF